MQVKIEKQDHFGRGIAFVNNKICFVDRALPNDICDIDITLEKKNYLEGKINKIIVASDDRQEVKCPYYDKCGGCHLLHQKYEKQLEFKRKKVSEILKRFAEINIDNVKINCSNEYNYRNKIVLHDLGMYKSKTNDYIKIKECLLVKNKINEIISRLNKYDNINATIKTTSLDKIMLIVDKNINIEEFEDLDSIYINNKLVYGKEFIEEEISGLKFHIYKDSFFQINYDVMKMLYNKIIDFYKKNSDLKVLDLYCGTGTIGMLVSKYAKNVIGIEVNSDAIESASKCSNINNINNAKFILGKVEENIDKIKDVDSIIVDPPRSGLDKHTIDTILELNPKSIIYVSCDPVTLARDLKILKDNYDIEVIELFDMFPNTYHIETYVELKRK